MTAALPLDAAAPAPARDAVRLMVARAGRPPGPHAVRRAARAPAARRPARRQRLRDAARRAARGGARRHRRSTSTCRRPSRRDDRRAAPRRTATRAGSSSCGAAAGAGAAARAGERLRCRTARTATLVAPYLAPGRLWVAELALPQPLPAYLARHGAPIRYAHQPEPRPLADHQTIFATEPGSAESPSAGRPFTPRVVEALRRRGVGVAAIVLHTGVSSLERGERPYPERFEVPPATAAQVNAARRVIAVGTTVTRALETVAAPDGTVHPDEGWTSLVITPERGVRAVDGLVTGWHEPDASHLLLLEAVAGAELVRRSYAAAAACGYRRHEFGDSHLLLP